MQSDAERGPTEALFPDTLPRSRLEFDFEAEAEPSPEALAAQALAESRRELAGMLGGRTGAIPVELLVEHLITQHGRGSWPVLREATNALLRRLAAVAE